MKKIFAILVFSIIGYGCVNEDLSQTKPGSDTVNTNDNLINATDNDGITALHRAVRADDFNRAKELVARGANVNIRDNDSITPLHWAALMGNAEIVQLLIEKGADIKARDKLGETPLHKAVSNNDPENIAIVRILIENGADPNAQDNDGETLLHFVATHGHLETAQFLIEEGANVDAKERINSFTPLSFAKNKGHSEFVELLKRYGAIESK